MKKNVKMGADPEFFIKGTDGRGLPAHLIFPPKDRPIDTKWGEISRDGYAVEFRPKAEVEPLKLLHNMGRLMREAERRIPTGFFLSAVSTVEIDPRALMKNAPEDVLLSGCHPSRNAYGLETFVPNMANYPFRHGAGHIHLSSTDVETDILSQPKRYPRLVRRLDLFLGQKLREIFPSPEYQKRSSIYGLWGEYREQKYPKRKRGVEYRTPGNEIWRHPAFALFTYEVARWVVQQGLADVPLGTFVRGAEEETLFNFLSGARGVRPVPLVVPGIYNQRTISALRKLGEKVGEEISSSFFLEWNLDWSDWVKESHLTVPLAA